jgi:hypothetical protein
LNNTVYGFNQQAVIDLHINDFASLTVLHWFKDFRDTGRMKCIDIDGKPYYWMNYNTLLEDYPSLGMSEHSLVKGPIKKLVDAHVLEHKTLRKGGTFSCYAVGGNFEMLLKNVSTYKQGKPRSNHRHDEPESTVGKGEYLP